MSTEPCAFVVGCQCRRQTCEDCRVIVVDPCDFVFGHHREVEERAVEGAESQGLKAEEVAELGGCRFAAEYEIFAADAVYVFTIKAGFV